MGSLTLSLTSIASKAGVMEGGEAEHGGAKSDASIVKDQLEADSQARRVRSYLLGLGLGVGLGLGLGLG